MAIAFSERLTRANQRLKSAGLGVALVQTHQRLYIQAKFPPKPTSKRQDAHQQKLATGKPCNGAGLDAAEKLAKQVAGELIAGRFDWEAWKQFLSKRSRRAETVGEWVEAFSAWKLGKVKASTWKSDYRNVFSQLPTDAELTAELLKGLVESKRANTMQRKRFAQSLGQLGRFAGLEVDFSELRGSYSARTVTPRDLPSDAEIVQAWESIQHPGWRWIFGMMATFGLRNCECFFLDLEPWVAGDAVLHVLDAKTEAHDTWAFHPEWVEQFGLRDVVYPFTQTYPNAEDFGRRVSNEACKHWPFSAYNLRHAWAVRTIMYGLPDSVAAGMMGHGIPVHQRTYQHWLGKAHSQAAVDRVLGRGDRPQPPAL
jgi:integrase